MDERTRQSIEALLAKRKPLTAETLQVMVALAVERHFEQQTVWIWEWVKRVAALAAIAGFIYVVVTS